MYRSLVREASAEQREKIDHELSNPGHEMKRIEQHPAVQRDPALGLRLRYQALIKSAKTEARKDELAHELGAELLKLHEQQTGA